VQAAAYKPDAHDNPTYMSHRDINANLHAAAARSPVDLVFDPYTGAALSAAFYADDDKKKVTCLRRPTVALLGFCWGRRRGAEATKFLPHPIPFPPHETRCVGRHTSKW